VNKKPNSRTNFFSSNSQVSEAGVRSPASFCNFRLLNKNSELELAVILWLGFNFHPQTRLVALLALRLLALIGRKKNIV